MSYVAIIFNKDRDSREQGLLGFTDNEILFKSSSSKKQISKVDLELNLGGIANKNLYFKSKADTSFKLILSDLSILSDPSFQCFLENTDVKAKDLKVKKKLKLELVSICLLMIFAIYFVCIEKEILSTIVVKSLPPVIDDKLGELVYNTSFKSKVFENEQLNLKLNQIAEPLKKSADLKNFDVKLHLIKEDSLNAFALPGGKIFVHSGLILGADSLEELQGVIAHEIAHVKKRHSLKNIVSELGVYALVQLVFSDVTGAIAVIENQALNLLSKNFSRHQESEADKEAFKYLMKAQIDSYHLEAFFEKLISNKKSNPLFGILSTHPVTEKRIDSLKELRYKNFYKGKSQEIDFVAFKNKLAQLVK